MEIKNTDQYLEAEQKIIHLMLQFKHVLDELIDERINSDYFSDRHQLLVKSIFEEYLITSLKDNHPCGL